MEKPVLSPGFTVDDIHKLREYNHERTKNLTSEERQRYYNDAGMEVHKMLQKMAAQETAGDHLYV